MMTFIRAYINLLAIGIAFGVGCLVGAAWLFISIVGVLEANGVHLRLF